jgi:hypothetical protein
VHVKPEISEVLKELNSKRRALRYGGRTIHYVELTAEERKNLYEGAREHGLLIGYEFSGVRSYGVSRNDAAYILLEATRQKAFRLLQREFGAFARFWVKPKQLNLIGIDFYWRKARLGLLITGPLIDDPSRGDPTRSRDSRQELEQDLDSVIPENMKGLTTIKMPYYIVWHRPSDLVSRIRGRLVASGQYPRLRDMA